MGAAYLGMFAATKANVRTAVAAHNHGQDAALSIAFYGGSIMGLCVASLGLLGLGEREVVGVDDVGGVDADFDGFCFRQDGDRDGGRMNAT